MSQVIRRHPLLVAANALLFVLLACAGASYLVGRVDRAAADTVAQASSPTASAASATPAPTDPLVYMRVQQLRQRLALTSADLGAIGCSQAQATALLSGILAWYHANAANWDSADAGQRSAEQQMAAAVRQVNVGPRDASLLGQLPAYSAAVTSARATFDQLAQGAASAVPAQLTYAQQQAWAVARANEPAGVPDPLRYAPSVSAAQVARFNQAMARAAASRSAGSAPSSDSVLSFAQQQALSTAATNQQSCMDGVLAAEQAVLPPPAVRTTPGT